MTGNQKDINLLPKELSQAKKGVKRTTPGALVEYTSFSGDEKKSTKTPSKPPFFSRLFSVFKRKKEVSKKPTLAFTPAQLPQKKKDAPSVSSDLPEGKPLPSALFEGVKQVKPSEGAVPKEAEKQAFAPGIVAGNVMSMHTPDFLNHEEQEPAQPAPRTEQRKSPPSVVASSIPAKTPVPSPVAQKTSPFVAKSLIAVPVSSKKVSWWRWLLFRKKEHPAMSTEKKPTPQPAPVQIPQKPAAWPPVPAPAPQAAVVPKPKSEPTSAPAPLDTAMVVAKKTDKGQQTEAPVHRLSGFDVNLLSAEYTETFKKGNPLLSLVSWTAVTVLVIGVSYGLIQLYQMRGASRLAEEENIVAALNETIASYQDLQNSDSVLRGKVFAARKLIGNHISWHAFLGKLEESTIPEITYLSMAASTEGMMNISAFAVDYTGLARQIVVYQQTPWIKDIIITSASRVEETPTQPAGVSFDMELDISPDILYADNRYGQ